MNKFKIASIEGERAEILSKKVDGCYNIKMSSFNKSLEINGIFIIPRNTKMIRILYDVNCENINKLRETLTAFYRHNSDFGKNIIYILKKQKEYLMDYHIHQRV